MIESAERDQPEEILWSKRALQMKLSRTIGDLLTVFDDKDLEVTRLKKLLEFIVILAIEDRYSLQQIRDLFAFNNNDDEIGLEDIEIAIKHLRDPYPVVVISSSDDLQKVIERFSDHARDHIRKGAKEEQLTVLQESGELTPAEKEVAGKLSDPKCRDNASILVDVIRSLKLQKIALKKGPDYRDNKAFWRDKTREIRGIEYIHLDGIDPPKLREIFGQVIDTRQRVSEAAQKRAA
jgi:hypothetical protein